MAKHDILVFKQEPTKSFSSFEYMMCTLSTKSKAFRVVIVYRPPKCSLSTFIDEFSELLPDIMLLRDDLVIVGDFNIHIDDPQCSQAKKFLDMLNSFRLSQHIQHRTHKHGHILDLVLTRPEQSPLQLEVADTLLKDCDHYAITFTLPTAKPPLPKKELSYRKYKAIDMDEFAVDIEKSQLGSLVTNDVDELAGTYNSVLGEILDKHAPLKKKVVTIHPTAPWYKEDIMNAKKERRHAEKKWRETGLCVHREIYCEARDKVTALIVKSKEEYYKDRINSSDDSQKALYACVKELLGSSKTSRLPSCESEQELSDRLATFFVEKIIKIRAYLDNLQNKFNSDQDPETQLVSSRDHLNKFHHATEEEVRKIVTSSASKSCCLDPVPTFMVKKCLHVLLPVITRIINLSFESARVPDCYKTAAVIPLLKKASLDPEVLNNFRPVSTLPFVSKTMERVASKRLRIHKEENKLDEKMQSAYRAAHSCETALMRIQNDILMALDSKKCVFLVLLDMSAAFDTVDHQMLLRRLSERLGIKGNALQWITSYLHNRQQFVTIRGTRSAKQQLDCNVPQGAVLGPEFFSDYDSPVAEIFRRHNIDFHLYADDTQVYLAFDPCDEDDALSRLEMCLSEVRLWMAQNYLKLNDSKTEFIVLGTGHSLKNINTSHITIGDSKVVSSDSVKNIGATLDKYMKLDKQVSLTCKSAWYNLYQISKIKNFLSDSQLKSVMQSFVISKLDQNNGLLVGSSKTVISKLQTVQNAAAKLVCGISRYDHVTPPLEGLHWLPISFRIQFKVLLLCYKSLHGKGPQYLQELLTPYQPARSLRSASSNYLVVPKSNLKTYGDRAFCVAGPTLWNSLPIKIRNSPSVDVFKKNLKTHLFKIAFNK
jgi:hypothetical protein